MSNAAREAGVVPRRIELVVAIDPFSSGCSGRAGTIVVKGGYANQLRRADDARFTEDLDLKIDAAVETAPELLASGFLVDLGDDFSYEIAMSPGTLEGTPGGGLRFVVVARLAGTELVRFKVDVSAADVVVGEFESYLSDPVVERLGFQRSRFPVYPRGCHEQAGDGGIEQVRHLEIAVGGSSGRAAAGHEPLHIAGGREEARVRWHLATQFLHMGDRNGVDRADRSAAKSAKRTPVTATRCQLASRSIDAASRDTTDITSLLSPRRHS